MWETTMNTQFTGLPPIPPEVLARLNPDQKAKMEAALKAQGGLAPRSTTSKGCLKKEDLEKPMAFGGSEQRACSPTIVSSTPSKMVAQIDCTQNQTKGTVTVEALNSESVKMTAQMAAGEGGRAMNMTMTGTSKWLGAVCTESK
jgi:hypothetical protein